MAAAGAFPRKHTHTHTHIRLHPKAKGRKQLAPIARSNIVRTHNNSGICFANPPSALRVVVVVVGGQGPTCDERIRKTYLIPGGGGSPPVEEGGAILPFVLSLSLCIRQRT